MIERLASHLLSVVLVLTLALTGDPADESVAVAAMVAAPAVAQDADDVARDGGTRRDVTMEDLEVLLGEWRATPTLPQAGEYEVFSRWERVLDGRFFKEERVTTMGESVTEEWSLIGLTPGARSLERWHFGSDGSTAHMPGNPDAPLRRTGRLVVKEGALWSVVFEGDVTARGATGPWRMTLSVQSHDQFDLLIERKPGDNWLPMTRQEFVRAKEADELDDDDAGDEDERTGEDG